MSNKNMVRKIYKSRARKFTNVNRIGHKMVASQFIRVDIETKQVLSTFKQGDWEPFNEVIKRLIMKVLGYEEDLTEAEKGAILKAIISVEKGKTQSFDEMIKNIKKKRASGGGNGGNIKGKKKDADGN